MMYIYLVLVFIYAKNMSCNDEYTEIAIYLYISMKWKIVKLIRYIKILYNLWQNPSKYPSVE